MAKVIILPEENLDQFYERTMQYLHAKYHSYPSSLTKHKPITTVASRGQNKAYTGPNWIKNGVSQISLS